MAEVFAISAVTGPLDVRVVDLLTGRGYPVGVTNVAQRISSGEIARVLIQNLGVSPIEIRGDQSIVYGSGVQIPARSQWTVAGGAAPIWGSPNYYDRNPKSIVFYYSEDSVVPAGATSRWSYTVPTGRRAFLEASTAIVQIESAPSGAIGTFAESYIFITPLVGTGRAVCLADISDPTAPTTIHGSRAESFLPTSMELQPGETIAGVTVNTLAAGICFHYIAAKLTEFDA